MRGVYSFYPLSLSVFIVVSITGNVIVAQKPNEVECSVDGICRDVTRNDDNMEQQEQCGAYMAESSIPNSGLGMYVGDKDIPDLEQLFYGDMVIHLEDLQQNNMMQLQYLDENNIPYEKKILERAPMLTSYIWESTTALGEFEAHDVQSLIPGLGMLANAHQGLSNAYMQYQQVSILYLLDRSTSPGAGAVTNYHNFHYLAQVVNSTSTTKTIQAGSEIFANYGDNWFKNRTSTLGILPVSIDFKEADELLINFLQELATARLNDKTSTDPFAIIPDDPAAIELYDKVLSSALATRPELHMALPNNVSAVYKAFEGVGLDIESVLQEEFLLKQKREELQYDDDAEGETSSEEDGLKSPERRITASWSVPDRIRSIEWLRKNGRCLDKIKPKVSTIKDAGMGAFATRHIKQGQIIAPMPLVHLPKSYLELYNVHQSNGTAYKEGYQQVFNYVYGHRDSSLVLLPYAPIVNYINHNHNHCLVNAKIQWSSLETKYNKYDKWKSRSTKELYENEHYCGLILEVVATRDIQQDEEIFLYYGSDWLDAWEKHVEQWIPPAGSEHYIPATVLNERRADVILTYTELDELLQQNKPIPYSTVSDDIASVFITISGEDQTRYPCEIVSRSDDNTMYTVVVTLQESSDGITEPVTSLVEDVPRSALSFVDKRYKSDLSIRTAFRHEIHIPDDIFPEMWKDLLPQASKLIG
jgi:SET domain